MKQQRRGLRAGYLTFPEVLPHPDDGEDQAGLLLLAAGPGTGLLLSGSGGAGGLISLTLHFNFLALLLLLSVVHGISGRFPLPLVTRDFLLVRFLNDGLGFGRSASLLGQLGLVLNRSGSILLALSISRDNLNGRLGDTACGVEKIL